MNKRRMLLASAATLMGTMLYTFTSFGGEWLSDGTAWKYVNDNGILSASCWQWIDGNHDGIAECAQARAEEIAELFSHTRPDGRKCFSIFDDNGIDYHSGGENIALGQRSPTSVMDSWMNSEGHRENILKDSYEEMGVGCYSKDGVLYWVQMFISR